MSLLGRKISLLLAACFVWSCLLPPAKISDSDLINSTRPIPLLVDSSIPLAEVQEAERWIENQVQDNIFVISTERPSRNFIDEIVFVPYSSTISASDLDSSIAGENIISTNSQTHVFLGSEILINKVILSDHTKLQVTLRHELLHDFFLHDLDCSMIPSHDIMCGSGPFHLDAFLTQEEIDFIRSE